MLNHNLEDFLRNLVLGSGHNITSTGVFKRAMLTGYLSIMLLGICIFYLVFDAFMGILNANLYYLTLINFVIIAFLLNRTGRYTSAKYLLLCSTLLVIILFSISEPADNGNYFNFFPLIMASFALFGYNQMHKGLIFSVLSIVIFILILLFDISILPERQSDPEMAQVNFMIHFFISITATILIILFLIKLNHTIESNLIRKDENLIKIAENLKESQQRFELAINGSNAGIYDWNIKENKIYHSPRWKRLLGYEDEELEVFSIETFYELIHPDDVIRVQSTLEAHLKEGTAYSVECRLKTKSGDYHWFADSGQALWNEHGEAIRMVGSIIKINERKVAEERIRKQNWMLEKTNLELDNFVYSASHDIRSPLTSILGLINIASRTDDPKEIAECLHLMKSRIARLDDFLQDILDFSRNLRMDKKLREINLFYFLNEIINGLDPAIYQKKVDIKLMVSQDFEVMSDPMRLKIILKNLISNALQFLAPIKPEQWVRISALRVEGHFQLIIEDNGEGIRNELKPRIFEMFYRASENSKGSGLGLYIVKEMVEKLEGSIKVNSVYGEGSQFIIELPDHRFTHKAQDSVPKATIHYL